MSQLFRGAALAAASLVVPAAPASAIVYVVTLGGAATENYVESSDGGRQDFTGGAFSATFRFDTALLPANAPDTGAGETFRYALEGGWFATGITFTGGAAPAFGGAITLNSLRGAFEPGGYVELQDDRLLRDDAVANETASLFIAGFDGLDAVSGSDFPDFLTARNLTFSLTNFSLDQASGTMTTTYAYGAIDSVNVAAVPEPAAWATMALGFGLLGAAARRRRRAAVHA